MGPLESLSAWLENKRRVAKRNLSDMLNNPDDYGRMAAARTSQDMHESMTPEGGLNFIGGPVGGLAGVIKPKGGNWIPEGIDKALAELTKRMVKESPDDIRGYLNVARLETPEAVPQYEQLLKMAEIDAPMRNWVEGPLRKYIMRDMATEGDPIRKLADQGILHYSVPTESYLRARKVRHKASMPMENASNTEIGRNWEDLVDVKISPRSVYEQLQAEYPYNAEGMPWLEKLNPKDTVYDLKDRSFSADLGFDHIVDELSNSLNATSGLPRNLQLRPEQIQQMGIDKAVRHVDTINKWRAANKAAEDQVLANKALTIREYAENNPKGLRWMELKANPEIEQALAEQELQKQLKYEGDVMGHCVGGYCPDVMEGHSRIFSLQSVKW